ncbi:MAG: hypothetical protein JXR29_08645 [Methylothermaceae bacterium]|nr:hypothetical protein [Methylothermaceae bacterium]
MHSVIRAKSNTRYRRRYSHPVDTSGGLRCDQSIVLTGVNTASDYPQPLHRIKYRDAETGKTFNFLTNYYYLFMLDVNNALQQYKAMIVSFKRADTEALVNGRRVRRFINQAQSCDTRRVVA